MKNTPYSPLLSASLVPLILFAASPVKADITTPEGWTKKPSADGFTLFVPDDLAAGQAYSIVFFSVEDKGNQSLAEWAKQRIEADKTVLASSVSPIQEQPSNNQTPSYSRIFTTANGPLVGIYTAFTTGGNSVCLTRILSSPDRDLIAQHKAGTGRILADQVRALRGTAPAPSTVAAKSHNDVKTPPSRPVPQKPRFPWTTAPGKGVQPDKIAGIVHAGRGVYQITGYQFVEETYLLLRDGTAYSGLVCPPSDLNVTASRQHEPDKWLRWKQQGKTLLVQQRGRSDWSKLEGFFVVPAKPGETLSGAYTTASAINLGGSVSTFKRGITFLPGNRFSTNSSSLSTSSAGMNTATGTSVSAYSDDEGSVVSAAPAAGSANPSNVTVSSQSQRPNAQAATSGTYQADGYALTLRYGNGTVERRPFFFWDTKKDSIWLGDSTLSKDKK